MAFQQGNTFGKYTKRGKNKSSDILKSQLHNLANKVVDEFDLTFGSSLSGATLSAYNSENYITIARIK